MCSVVHTWRSLFMVTMEGTTPKHLCNSSEAIRKRKNRVVLKEKRREDTFVNRYVQIKYPDIYTEIIAVYKSLADNYPGRADLTKTFFFQEMARGNQSDRHPTTTTSTIDRQSGTTTSIIDRHPTTTTSNITQQTTTVSVVRAIFAYSRAGRNHGRRATKSGRNRARTPPNTVP